MLGNNCGYQKITQKYMHLLGVWKHG